MNWLKRETEAADLALFQFLFCSALGLQLLLHFQEQLEFYNRYPLFRDQLALLGRFGRYAFVEGIVEVPALSPWGFSIAGISLILSLFTTAFGYRARAFLILALFSYFAYFGQILPLVSKKTNSIPFVLLILACAPGIDRFRPGFVWSQLRATEPQRCPAWPLTLVKLFLAATYFSAGLNKLLNSGPGWVKGDAFRAALVEHYLSMDISAGFWLAQYPSLCGLFSLAILLFELTFPLVLFSRPFGYFYALVGLGFHVGVRLTLGINYLTYFALAYVVFLDAGLVRAAIAKVGAGQDV